ncbi:testicular haploid expressed protein -like [Brachionus plicatilis]|uniref:Testicular haploid expressed protein-like n=1 Tax=Brachionus plicatilis TaxID=10195 RepID=A0A3M7PUY0_BRAPC|nr:testicular haploid expressed protein -like [Brachionus plicatilis]
MIKIPSTRLQSLSQPRLNRCEHQPRSSYTLVPLGALKFETTSRLASLSLPRLRNDNHVKTEFSRFGYDPTNSCVFNKTALRAQCSEHVNSLARPKFDYNGYQFAYPVQREISKGAKSATATERILKLATPRIKKDNHVKEL